MEVSHLDPDVTVMYLPSTLRGVPRDQMEVILSHKFDRKVLPSKFEEDIRHIWELRKKENGSLWNGTKYRIDSVTERDNKSIFHLGITCYRDFIGTNWSPKAKEIQCLGKTNCSNTQVFMSDALGVGSLVETSDNFIILLKRSMHCGEAVGLWDIPGGHPEPQELVGKVEMEDIKLEEMSAKDVVDEIFNSTLREICDEVNIPGDSLSDPILLGIARNMTSAGRPSSEYYVKCSLTKNEVEDLYRKGTHSEADESTNILFIPIIEVHSLRRENSNLWNELAPSAKGCLTLYCAIYSSDR